MEPSSSSWSGTASSRAGATATGTRCFRASWANRPTPGVSISIAKFYIASPEDGAARINAALRAGRNLILSPGVYHLDHSIVVARAGTVVLGLGFATLIADNGVIPMTVTAPKGVSISGVIFEAGATRSPE